MGFQERYNRAVMENHDTMAFEDEADAITFAQLDERSGRIYSYLKSKGIGKEDRVMLLLPRSVNTVAAMIGVIKAGAAFVPLEDTYPEERVEYIKKDSACRVVINGKLLREIYSSCEPASGFADAQPHDAAYIVYTSGSTGNPKGVVHEYGNLDQYIASAETLSYGKRVGFAPALYFVAGVMLALQSIIHGDSSYIVSHDLLRDPEMLMSFFIEKKIQLTFMSASYIRLLTDPGPYLEEIQTGGESASGIYYPNGKPVIRNLYALSETGFNVFGTILDREYDLPPAGKPMAEVPYYLVDENGNVIDGPGEGEVCFGNEFVRGYLNLPEKTAYAWRGGMFHTGDLARRDEDGIYYILGRLDDMIKINGNRVEPAEIEAKVQTLTGLDKVIARAFEEHGRALICVYYLKGEAEKLGIFKDGRLELDRDALKRQLPDYMQPAFYVPLEEFPINVNGKVARNELKLPDVNACRREYEPPMGEAEKYICRKMAEVLGLEKISATEDFFELGGDSLKAIEMVAACREHPITATLLYEYPTPRLLAMHCGTAVDCRTVDETAPAEECREILIEDALRRQREFAETGEVRLLADSSLIQGPRVLIDPALSPCTHIVFKEKLDKERLSIAANKAAGIHPYVTMEIHQNPGSKIYSFRASQRPIVIFPTDETVSFGEEKNNFHHIIIKRGEQDIFVHINHVLTDGYGISRYINTMLALYFSPELAADMVPDTEQPDYFADVMERGLPVSADFMAPESGPVDYFKLPETDDRAGQSIYDTINVSTAALERFCRKKKISVQVGLIYFVAETVRRVHPDNRKQLAIRCPMNVRELFGIPNSFQNASMPHGFFYINPEDLKDRERTIKGLRDSFAGQYNYDNLAHQSNLLAFRPGPDSDCVMPEYIREYMAAARILVSFLGQSVTVIAAEHVACNELRYDDSPFQLMVYASALGETTSLQLIRSFKSDAYTAALREVLTEALS